LFSQQWQCKLFEKTAGPYSCSFALASGKSKRVDKRKAVASTFFAETNQVLRKRRKKKKDIDKCTISRIRQA
jgi:hypothetical protein